jgi:hypothetical protein
MRLGFKALASIAALVIGSLAYLLGSPLLAVACVLLSLFFSKEKLKAFYEQHAGALKSSASTASSNKSNIETWDNKENTPAKPADNLASKRRDIGLELLNSRLASTGNTELLV